jgi:DNA-binding XRE family transcriptional regulator
MEQMMATHDHAFGTGDFRMNPSEPMVPTPNIIAFHVRSWRQMRNWKRTTLADFARVSLSTVERIERAEKVSDENLDRVAQALGFQKGPLRSSGASCRLRRRPRRWQAGSMG